MRASGHECGMNGPGARRTTVALVCFVAIAASGSPSPADARILDQVATSTGKPFAIARPEITGIKNFAEIEPGLARGAIPTDEGLMDLKARGFRTVISFIHSPEEREKLARLGITYVELPIRAGILGAAAPKPEQIETFLDIVSDSTKRPVFFHCRRGRDRTGALAAIYRVERNGWRKPEALEEMRAFGFHSYYHRLKSFVESYEPSVKR